MALTRWSLLIVLALVAGFSSAGIAAPGDVLVPKEQRTPAPKLVFSDIPGARRQFSQFKGKVIVVNFWATWCVPCKTEMPEFVKVYAAYKDRGVEFVGAANEPRSAKAKVREFMQALQIQFPVWLEASEDQHMKALGVGPGIPATVILDRQGRVAARIAGVTDAAQLRDLLDRILSEPTASDPPGGR
jgi:thiol-disulfide isomerase/thioredoxin